MRTLTVKNQEGQAFEVDEDKVIQAERDGFLPVVSNGEQEHRVSYNDLPQAQRDGFDLVASKTAPIISAVRKGAQGLVSGFLDEGAGAMNAGLRAIGLENTAGPIENITLANDYPSMDDLKQAYKAGRDDMRASLAKDSKDNPGISTASEIGAAIVSPVNKIAKGMSLVKGGAVLGGLYGLGNSEKETLAGNLVDTAVGAGTGALTGKVVDKVSKAIAPTSQALAQKISPALEKKNTQQIIEAADRLGIKVTPGMLDDTGFVQRLEHTLANSPSLFGQSVSRNQQAVLNKLDDAISAATKDASNLSPHQIGDKFKSGITAKVGERLDPITTAFQDVAESTKAIGITEKSKEAIINNIKKIPEVRLNGGKGKVGEYLDIISNIQTADDAQRVSSMLGADIRAAEGKDKLVLMAIKDKVSIIENKSINRAALTAAKEAGLKGDAGKQIGKELISDLKGARKGYKGLATDLNAIAENTRVKFQGGPAAYLDRIEAIPNEQIQQKFFNTENLRQLQGLKEKFPEQFDLLRQGKLQDIVESSLKPVSQGDAGVSSVKFINQVNKLNPEAKQLLFGESGVKVLSDIETVQRSMPKNFNPSGTGSQIGWSDAIYSNGKDAVNYVLYKGASTNLGNKLAKNLKTPDFTPIQKQLSGAVVKSQIPAVIGSSAAAGAGVKGIEKWITNGQQRVIENDASIDPQFLEQQKSNKKFKDQLIRAGDKTTSKNRLNEIVDQIKSSEEYKKFIKEKEKQAQRKEPDQAAAPKIKFPLVVQKDGYTAVVRNADELSEAKSEGWA